MFVVKNYLSHTIDKTQGLITIFHFYTFFVCLTNVSLETVALIIVPQEMRFSAWSAPLNYGNTWVVLF